MNSSYSIKDLEQLSGIKAHTLRIWEQRHKIICPKRTETNIRYYDNNDLKLVLNIALLKENGFKIAYIAKMSPDDLRQEVMAVTEKALKYPEQIQALTIAMLDLDEDRFEKIMGLNILKFGFEATMIQIVYPFLGRIGTLWLTGAVSPAQEHFITYLIRQKLIVATDAQLPKRKPDARKYLLYLPDGELHELSLLFANYLIRSRGHRTIYLGQSLPFEDLRLTFEAHQPHCILAIITSLPGQDEVQHYVNKLARHFSTATILLSGYQVVGQAIHAPTNVIILQRMDEFITYIDQDHPSR
ncbi:MAG: MerR family transcriptional regulator [Ferruginibacter sp.]|nr:MerR family transcriptional regulator [Cytophagales bacterium]